MDEQQIRERAYHLWLNAGRPHGRDQEFWERAGTAAQPTVGPRPAKASVGSAAPQALPVAAAAPAPVPIAMAAAANPRKKAKAAKGA